MKKRLRCKIIRSLLNAALCACISFGVFKPVYANEQVQVMTTSERSNIHILINGFEPTDMEPIIIDGVTYVPLRIFCGYFVSGSFEWDVDTVTASSESYTLEVKIGSPYIIANGRYIYYGGNVINRLFDGVTYVPLRSIGKLFGLEIIWEQSTGTVYINGESNIIESGDSFYDSDDLYWLSRIISAESKGEPLTGKIAVGNVIMNRVDSSEFPDDIESVIFDNKNGVQFTPVKNLSLYETPTEESVIAAKICLEGYSISDSILYFLNEAISTQKWIQNNCTYEFKIENHTFYS